MITPSTVTAVSDVPSGAESVWGISSLFLSDWTNGCQITNSWPTSIVAAANSAEKRATLTSKPSRILKFTIRSTTRQQAWAIKNILLRMAQCRSLIPLYPDYTLLTSPVVSGNTAISCDTTNRRFFDGAQAIVYTPTGNVGVGTNEIVVISSLTGSAINISSGAANSYPLGSRVAPLIECDIWATSDANVLDGGMLSVDVIAKEVPGGSSLPSLADPGDSFGYNLNASGGIPVFDLGPNPSSGWRAVTDGWRQDNKTTRIGEGSVVELFGPRPRAHSGRQAKAIGRDVAWKMLKFFDASRGETFPFIAPLPFPLFTLVSLGSATAEVTASGPLEDWQNYPYLVLVVGRAGPDAVSVLTITNVNRSGGIDTVTFTPSITAPALSLVVCLTVGNLMRFDTSEITERWRTSQNLSLDFTLIEVLNEGAVTIDHLGGSGILAIISPLYNIDGGPIAWFNEGEVFPAGSYVISCLSGAIRYWSDGPWCVSNEDLTLNYNPSPQSYPPSSDDIYSYFCVYNTASGSFCVQWQRAASVSVDTDVAATQAGLLIAITLTEPSPIGMFLYDSDYSDNSAGPTVGPPTFQLSST